MNNKTSICVLCSHNCGIIVSEKNNSIIKIKADKDNPRTKGYICNKAYGLSYYNHHKQRVTSPLKRKPDGTFSKISWERAVSEIAEKLKNTLINYGADSFALCGVGGQANHLDTLYALSFLKATKSRWWFNALAQEKTQHIFVDKLLFKSASNSWYHVDFENTDYLLMMGTNPLVSNRGLRPSKFISSISKSTERTLVVVDPRKSETAKKADIHLQIRPGTDAYFLITLIKLILDKNLYDRKFIQMYCRDFSALAEEFKEINPRETAEITGLSYHSLEQLAVEFSASKKAGIFFDLGVEQTLHSTLISYLIRIVSIITGNIGGEGQNIFQGMFSPASSISLSVPKAKQSNIKGIRAMGPFAMFSTNLIAEEILSNNQDRIRFMIVEGSNPVLSAADTPKLTKALKKLDLLVVIDPVLSETAMLADYVLPVPSAYEKWEYSAFPSGYPEIFVQLRPPVLEKPPETLTEAEIYFRLAKKAGLISPLPSFLKGVRDFFDKVNITGEVKAKTLITLTGIFSAIVPDIHQKGKKEKFLQKNTAENIPAKTFSNTVFRLYELMQNTLPDAALSSLWLLSHLYSITNRSDILRVWKNLTLTEKLNLGETLFSKILQNPRGIIVSSLNKKTNLQDNLGYKDKKIRLMPEPFAELIKEAVLNPPQKNKDYPFILNAGLRTNKNANTIYRNPAWRKGEGPFCFIAIHPDDAEALNLKNNEKVKVSTKDTSFSLPVKIDSKSIPGSVHIPNGFGVEYPDADNILVSDGINLNEFTAAEYRDAITGIPYHKYIEVKLEKLNE